MKDRVPIYPGRVTLTPVSGQANTFDLVRADQPTQEGTPINKASLLKDATAALYGKTNAAVPDDILNLLSKSTLAQIKEKYTKTTIGTLAIGKTITLNVSGTPKEFIVVHQGKPSSLYDDSCSGTWLLMKDIYENRVWQSGGINKYESSDVHAYLNSTFLNLFDSNIKNAIKQAKIPYRKNGGSGGVDQSGANGLPAKIFLLSGYEVGWTTSNFPLDGAKLSYFESGTGTSANNKRIANLTGSAATWWLRSQNTFNADHVWGVLSNGDYNDYNASSSFGIRPALVLPSTLAVYTDSSGNIYTEQEYDTKITDVLGNLIAIPAGQIKDGVKIATGSYTGTGTYGSSNPNSLTFAFAPKLVFMFKDKLPLYMNVDTTEAHPVYGTTIGMTTAYSKSLFNIYGRRSGDDYYLYAKKSIDGKTLSWYQEAGAKYQMNDSDVTFNYIAIG